MVTKFNEYTQTSGCSGCGNCKGSCKSNTAKTPQLSRPQLQMIKSMLQDTLTAIEEDKAELKEAVADLWEQSIPNTIEGAEAFEILNDCKAQLRYAKRTQAKLAAVQHTVKRLLTQ